MSEQDWKDKMREYAIALMDKAAHLNPYDLSELYKLLSLLDGISPPAGNGNGDTPPETPYLIDMLDTPPVEAIKVTVIDKVPLKEVSDRNKAGRPIWGNFGKRIIKNRITAKADKGLWVERAVKDKPIEFKGDGGIVAHQLLPGQVVDGYYLYNENGDRYKQIPGLFSTIDMNLYVLKKHVR